MHWTPELLCTFSERGACVNGLIVCGLHHLAPSYKVSIKPEKSDVLENENNKKENLSPDEKDTDKDFNLEREHVIPAAEFLPLPAVQPLTSMLQRFLGCGEHVWAKNLLLHSRQTAEILQTQVCRYSAELLTENGFR